MKSLIIGAGTYGEVYLAYLQDAGVDIIGFIDDSDEKQGAIVRGVPVIGKLADLPRLKEEMGAEAVYCPLGKNDIRVKCLTYAKSVGYKTPNYIHPSANIHHSVKIGEGVYVLLGVNIMPYTVLEDYVMISMNALVAHHTTLKKGTFLSTGVNFGASIVAHENAYVGIGATIMTGLHNLGADCLVGAGAVVIKDVPEKAIMAGVPAKVIRIKD